MYKKEMKQHIWQDIVIGIVVVILVAITQRIIYNTNPDALTGLIGIKVDMELSKDIIITQYTITFLIVSLLSLLSGNGEYIYWINVLEQKIIAPKHLNFTSMSVYAFLFMFAGTFAFFGGNFPLVLLFFSVDVILLVFLTFRMTSVYFGKERLRRSLYKKIEKEVKEYLKQPNAEKLECIEEKLNGIYENATKLAERKQYGEILETDFQLLIDISEMMDEIYVNEFAKIIYGNITKILLIFTESSDYIFSRLNATYHPFSNTSLQTHTVEMIQSALASYYEKVLADENYQISQNFWISSIYRNLSKSYLHLLQQAESTSIIASKDYFNYEGEVLFHQEDYKGLGILELSEAKLNLVHEKLLRFSQLIYKNSPELFFKVICEHGMPIDLILELDVLRLICKNDRLNEALKACEIIVDKVYIFELNRYIDTYHKIYMTIQISRANGEEEFRKKFFDKIQKDAYLVREHYKEMMRTAIAMKSAPVLQALLGCINKSLSEIYKVIRDESAIQTYDMLFNEETNDALIYNVQFYDEEFKKLLDEILELFVYDVKLCKSVEKLERFYQEKHNFMDLACAKREFPEYIPTDVKEEW